MIETGVDNFWNCVILFWSEADIQRKAFVKRDGIFTA